MRLRFRRTPPDDRIDRTSALIAIRRARRATERNQPIGHNTGDTDMHLCMRVSGNGSN